MTSYEAYTPARPAPVRTFSHRDMAEKYQERMAAIGAQITIKRVRTDRRLVA